MTASQGRDRNILPGDGDGDGGCGRGAANRAGTDAGGIGAHTFDRAADAPTVRFVYDLLRSTVPACCDLAWVQGFDLLVEPAPGNVCDTGPKNDG